MYTAIKLDKSRNFKYGMKALSLVEKALKKPIGSIDFNTLTIEENATVIWAGLVHEDSALTVDKVMDLVDEHSSIKEVVEKMGEALNEAFGDKEEKN